VAMDLLVIRHAIAADPGGYADDAARPLTPEGKKKMRQIVRGLRSSVSTIDVLATSPLTRAVETAEIVSTEYEGIAPVVVPALAPGHPPAAVAQWLDSQRRHDVVAVVGHEPGLSCLVSWLLAGSERSFIELKKGAICRLAFPGAVAAGSATLIWALAPSQLREIK
jgi:phosphohistidine phosphatase